MVRLYYTVPTIDNNLSYGEMGKELGGKVSQLILAFCVLYGIVYGVCGQSYV